MATTPNSHPAPSNAPLPASHFADLVITLDHVLVAMAAAINLHQAEAEEVLQQTSQNVLPQHRRTAAALLRRHANWLDASAAMSDGEGSDMRGEGTSRGR